MHDLSPPRVLILARQAETGRRWRDALAPVAAGVWLSEADLPAGQRVDVVVTDLAVKDAKTGVGMVAIGAVSGADVTLPPDCTDRELCLATVLVAEIARLRGERDELDRIRGEATQLAQTDPLTGLANRRAWEHQLQARLARGTRGRGSLWLAIVDLDGFKQVNDRLGMSQGDEVLARAAGSLAGQLRREDVVARLGGDEFGVLLWNVTEEQAQSVFDRLRAAVAREAPPEGFTVTASIGFVAAGQRSATADQLFVAAERAMREAKRAGGNRAILGDVQSPSPRAGESGSRSEPREGAGH